MQKTREQILRRWMTTGREGERLLLAALTARFFNRWVLKEVEKQTREDRLPIKLVS